MWVGACPCLHGPILGDVFSEDAAHNPSSGTSIRARCRFMARLRSESARSPERQKTKCICHGFSCPTWALAVASDTNRSRKTNFWILPDGVSGNSSTNFQ